MLEAEKIIAGAPHIRYSPVAADQVEECWQLLRQSMRSVSYASRTCRPTPPGWPARTGRPPTAGTAATSSSSACPTPAAAGCSSHLFALDALLLVYPDALVVQTHQAPRTAIASVCSLAAHASAGWSHTFRGEVIGRDQLQLWTRGLERFTAERARHDPARFHDVDNDAFVADPIGAVESLHGHFGLTGQQVDERFAGCPRAPA